MEAWGNGKFCSNKLLSLPPELISHLAGFLTPKQLLLLSGSCHRLREVLNNNSIWKKHTDGGVVSKALDKVASTVPPKLSIPSSPLLQALCEHRLHFLKQSRLLNNIRQRNFVSHEFLNFKIPMNFSEFETTRMPTREITYKGIYLFTLSYSNDLTPEEEVGVEVDVYNIAEVPKLITCVRLVTHGEDDSVLFYLEIVDDLLVVRQDDYFDFLKISLPQLDFPHLFTINVNSSQDMEMGSSNIINNELFVVNTTEKIVEVWSLLSKAKSYSIQTQVPGELRWEALSKDKKNILFFSDFGNIFKNPCVLVYSIPSKQFTSFSLKLSNECGIDCKGLIDSNYVVILSAMSNVSVFVYDIESGSLVAEKQNLESRFFEHAQIVANNLLFPDQFQINIMDLKTLESVSQLHFECGGLTDELPLIVDMQCLSISNISTLILVSKTDGSELWDYDTGKRLFHFSKPSLYAWVNDTYSMIVLLDSESGCFQVLNFW